MAPNIITLIKTQICLFSQNYVSHISTQFAQPNKPRQRFISWQGPYKSTYAAMCNENVTTVAVGYCLNNKQTSKTISIFSLTSTRVVPILCPPFCKRFFAQTGKHTRALPTQNRKCKYCFIFLLNKQPDDKMELCNSKYFVNKLRNNAEVVQVALHITVRHLDNW